MKNKIQFKTNQNSSFRIEATILNHENAGVDLQYCFFWAGQKIGNNSGKADLELIIKNFNRFISEKGKRNFVFYEEQNLNDFADELIAAFSLEKNEEEGTPMQDIVRLNINSKNDPCFANIYTFLIEKNDFDIFLSKDINANTYVCGKIAKGDFYKTLEEFIAWIAKNTKLAIA